MGGAFLVPPDHNSEFAEYFTQPAMKISGNVLVATIVFLVAVIVIGPHTSFGVRYTGDRYEIPNAGASSSVQQ